MYHSITFGDGSLYPSGHEKEGQFMGTNTWDDWHLIPAERPSIASPGVSTSFVEIPGRDGAIDMSTFLMNRPVYGSRQGSWDFYVDNDHEYWESIRMRMMTFLHGKRYRIVLEDDPNWYWEGRFAVDNWRSDPSNSRIQINYQIDPYKRKFRSEGDQDIIWDDFNFQSDYDYYASLHPTANGIALNNSSYSAYIMGYDFPFEVFATAASGGSNINATMNGRQYVIAPGTTVSLGKVKAGINQLNFVGTGNVTVSFTGGSL